MMNRFPTSSATGFTVFTVLLTLGMLLTRRFVDQAVANGPRAEAYEAMYWDILTIEYTVSGWILSLIVAAVFGGIAFLISVRIRRNLTS